MVGAELRPGLDARLLDERLPRLAIDLERLGLALAAVEGEHQLPGEPLSSAVTGDELLQLADERGVAPGGQVGLHAQLERGQPLLLEPRDLRLRERLEGHVGERGPAPERQRLAQDRPGPLRPAGGQRGPPSSTLRAKRSASSSSGSTCRQ